MRTIVCAGCRCQIDESSKSWDVATRNNVCPNCKAFLNFPFFVKESENLENTFGADINSKHIFFRLMPYILAELSAFFFVDYTLNTSPPPFSDGTTSGVVLCTYFVPVFLMMIRIKSLIAKCAVVLGSFVYLAFALDMVLSKLRHVDHFLARFIIFLPGFILLLIVVARTKPPWDWRTFFQLQA